MSLVLERLTISVEEAARVLGISRGSAYEAAKRGQLSTVRIGKHLIVPVAALEQMLASAARNPKKVRPFLASLDKKGVKRPFT